MATKTYPATKHDGSPWTPADGWRYEKRGQPMRYRCVLLYIKGDWAEYASTLAFPTWADALRCCFKCNTTIINRNTIEGISPVSCGPFHETVLADLEEACNNCERLVILNKRIHLALCKVLVFYDKRKNGGRGLCLTHGPVLEELGLSHKCRLEP